MPRTPYLRLCAHERESQDTRDLFLWIDLIMPRLFGQAMELVDCVDTCVSIRLPRECRETWQRLLVETC